MEERIYKRGKYLKRIRPFYDADDIIKAITGVRRCDKSLLMKTIMEELRSMEVPEGNVIYIDLDQRKYRNVSFPISLRN